MASLEFLMRQCGFETRVARDGEEAIGALAEYRPDLVLLDIMLPGSSGFEICRMIRERPGAQGDPGAHAHRQGRPGRRGARHGRGGG